MIKYGLRLKKSGEILGWAAQSNGDDIEGSEVNYILDPSTENQWLVNDDFNAEYVRQISTEWYNSSYETPSHNFEPSELEVIQIEMNVIPINVKIPTMKEWINEKYKDPEEKEYLKNRVRGPRDLYTIWDLKEFFRKKKQ